MSSVVDEPRWDLARIASVSVHSEANGGGGGGGGGGVGDLAAV
jgi:hypothetical protein